MPRQSGFAARFAVDVLVVGAVCAAVVVVGMTGLLREPPGAPGVAGGVLTMTAAAVGAGAAILSVVTARLSGDLRVAWLAPALAVYCMVVLPWSVAAPAAGLDAAPRLARLVAYATALILLLAAIHPPRRLPWWSGWVVAIAGAAATGLALGLSGAGARDLVESSAPTVAVFAGWTVAAVGFLAHGLRHQNLARCKLGLGLLVIAGAQLYRLLWLPTSDATDLAFATLRLVGLVVVLVGLAGLVSAALHGIRRTEWRQREELGMAAQHMARAAEHAAERDHELRNGLAGLAGITHLLSAVPDGDERLKLAVLSELGRLHRILDGEDLRADGSYAVAPVLAGLVALRGAGNAAVDFDADGTLFASGDSAVLAQIVTNLLANCDRHAPGAPVRVRAYARGDSVVVDVRDEGPGLPSGPVETLFDRGSGDADAGGAGLGLHISRRLAERDGGTLELYRAVDPPGCLARVRIPAARCSDRDSLSPSR